MPILTKLVWKLKRKWDSENYEEWTEKMMVDELKDLHSFLIKLAKKNPFLKNTASLELFIELILSREVVEIGNQSIDFSQIKEIIDCWKHVTNTCEHYGREFIAQDESRLVCFKHDKRCSGKKSCENYKPMLEARPIEKLIKEEIEWSVS